MPFRTLIMQCLHTYGSRYWRDILSTAIFQVTDVSSWDCVSQANEWSCLRRSTGSLLPSLRHFFFASVWKNSALVILLVLWGISFPAASSDQGSTVSEDYAALLRARSSVGPLNIDDMFGDRIGLFTGSVEFLQADVSIPGNNGLEVAIKRRITAGTQAIQGLGMFGNWDMAIPSMHGMFSTQGGWRNYTTEPFKRCSRYTPPADETTTHAIATELGGITVTQTFRADEFWRGTFLYLPETGEEELLSRNGDAWPAPTDGYIYGLRTKSGSAIRCIPTEDGTGEGFEVTTPAGITYRLDHIATGIGLTPLIKPPVSPIDRDYEHVLYRQESFLLPTNARDRFGNTVSYTWDAANPKQLTRISSSDGRVLDITWSNGRISQVKHGDKIWTYAGNRITLPDQSYWLIGAPVASSRGEGSVPGERGYCGSPGSPTTLYINASMTHPSGAVATFTFKPILHGRSKSTYSCSMTDSLRNSSTYEQSVEGSPARYYTWSITSKTVSGPGIATPYVWTYTYGPDNGCYSGGTTNSTPSSNLCQPTSPTTKWVDVLDPSGVATRYTYGNQLNVDDGYLLSISKPGQTTTQTYQWDSPGSYPAYAGGAAKSRGGAIFASKIIPLKEKSTVQDGVKFTWHANAYDTWARPTSVTKSSAPSP